MRRLHHHAAAMAALGIAATVAACSTPADDPTAISADDQRQLNDAAAMLDANSMAAHTPPRTESSPHD